MSPEPPISEDDLHAYVDGVLDPVRRGAVEAYLDKEPEAARRVEAYAAHRAGLRAALAPYAEEPVPATLSLARLVAAQRRPAFAWWQNVAAALVVFVVGGAGGWSLRAMAPQWQTGPRPLVMEAADTYRVYGSDRQHPVEIKADARDSLMEWAAARLQRHVTAPDIVNGYRLMGGRVVPTSRGPAVMFMYDDHKGTRLVLMVCPLSIHGTAPMTASAQGTLTGISWADHGMGYSLVGPASDETLRPLAEDARRQIEEKV